MIRYGLLLQLKYASELWISLVQADIDCSSNCLDCQGCRIFLQAAVADRSAGSSGDDLEGFLVKIGLEASLPALTTCGYDLDTLVKGAAQGSAFSITPEVLRAALQEVGHTLPIGSCTKIMLRAEELQKQLR